MIKYCLALLTLFVSVATAQNTVVDTIPVQKDAMIRQHGGVGDPTNFGSYAWNNMHAWTNSGQTVLHRSLIDFDLSHIPDSTTITSAYLLLEVPPTGSKYASGHFQNNENSCEVQRITQSWVENQVNWNNQPNVSPTNKVIIPASDSAYQSYSVDVTNLVQDMVDQPNIGHGFYIKLNNEVSYRRMVFASKESSYPNLAPRLVVEYDSVPPVSILSTATLDVLQDAMIREVNGQPDLTNYGNFPWNNMHSWTNNGAQVNHRSLIEFDLSGVPDTAILISAYLELKMDRDSNAIKFYDGHQNIDSNGFSISRITSPWNEYSVSWFNQPSRTAVNQQHVNASNSAWLDYSVDVSQLVKDMLNDTNSHGFYLQLQDETPYRRMVFASRNNADSSAHPKLILNFGNIININLGPKEEVKGVIVALYPNPVGSYLTVDLKKLFLKEASLKIYDSSVSLQFEADVNLKGRTEISLDILSQGIYYYQISAEQGLLQYGKILKK